jgi:hypothetical protein
MRLCTTTEKAPSNSQLRRRSGRKENVFIRRAEDKKNNELGWLANLLDLPFFLVFPIFDFWMLAYHFWFFLVPQNSGPCHHPCPACYLSRSASLVCLVSSLDYYYTDPIAAKGVDNIIPSDILSKAQGLAIFTVVKAGFLFSGRAGSGIVVARLEDGSWSAPSAIGTGGMGFGGQIGAEITDFVVVLNNKMAVRSFATGGNVTLGGNLSGTLSQ